MKKTFFVLAALCMIGLVQSLPLVEAAPALKLAHCKDAVAKYLVDTVSGVVDSAGKAMDVCCVDIDGVGPKCRTEPEAFYMPLCDAGFKLKPITSKHDVCIK